MAGRLHAGRVDHLRRLAADCREGRAVALVTSQDLGERSLQRIDVELTYSAGGANVATATVSPDPVSFEAVVPAAAMRRVRRRTP